MTLAPRPPPVEFVLLGDDMQLKSLNRTDKHWSAKSDRVFEQRTRVAAACEARKVRATWPVLLTLTRLRPHAQAKKPLDRWDNLPGSCKPVIDGVCDHLQINDADLRFNCKFEQDVADDWGVRIRVESLGNEVIVPVEVHEPRAPKPSKKKSKIDEAPKVRRGAIPPSALPIEHQARARAAIADARTRMKGLVAR